MTFLADASTLQIIAFTLMVLAALLGMGRLVVGPTISDRVVAADALGTVAIAGLVWLAGWLGRAMYLDIALVYGALAFVGVVAIARAIERHSGDVGPDARTGGE